MSKVLSTKLAVNEAERFNTAAKQQGLSKAGLLKQLVKEYLEGSNEERKTSNNSKPRSSCSFEKRQTPTVRSGERPLLDKQEVSQNKKLQKCLNHVHPIGRTQNCTWPASTDGRVESISSTVIDPRIIASLAKAPDSRYTITMEPSVEQRFLKVMARTQATPKVGFGELLFFSLMALGIVLVQKRNSNQKILPEPNYGGRLS